VKRGKFPEEVNPRQRLKQGSAPWVGCSLLIFKLKLTFSLCIQPSPGTEVNLPNLKPEDMIMCCVVKPIKHLRGL
jgi:hypothetical protein